MPSNRHLFVDQCMTFARVSPLGSVYIKPFVPSANVFKSTFHSHFIKKLNQSTSTNSNFPMSDTGRKGLSEQISQKLTPDAMKTNSDKTKENVSGTASPSHVDARS